MVHSDYGSLLKELESPKFECFQCINYLRQYNDNIGVQHALVNKLYKFSYDELEFFIPQFIQIIVTFKTDSMALEEFLLYYCGRYPHFSLIVFWNLQAYIFELRNDPESYSFQIVRKIINRLQNIMFNPDTNEGTLQEFRENLQPALVLCGVIAASAGLPGINSHAQSLIKLQAKQQKSFVFKLANFQKALTRNLTMKNQRLSSDVVTTSTSDDEKRIVAEVAQPRSKSLDQQQRFSTTSRVTSKGSSFLSDESEANTTDEDFDVKSEHSVATRDSSSDLKNDLRLKQKNFESIEDNLKINTTIKSKKSSKSYAQLIAGDNASHLTHHYESYNSNSHSLPDLSKAKKKESTRPYLSPTESETSLIFSHYPIGKDSKAPQNQVNNKMHSHQHLVKILQANYAKKETNFIMSLQNVSFRLSQVPKEARLSALRAELSIINESILPSEIDIPQLLPITSNKNKKYHKILRLSINEACVLNSAERVPFLLLIEYLSDEIDFNPQSPYNQKIINSRGKADDIKAPVLNTDMIDMSNDNISVSNEHRDHLDETNNSDIQISQPESDLTEMPVMWSKSSQRDFSKLRIENSFENLDIKRAESPITPSGTTSSTKALADQMRIASVMLQQLENSGQASSEQSVSIKNRIVSSMISLQDQFDFINYDKLNQLRSSKDDAGERKLENDFKLGEDWITKKNRIRSASIYGHLPNWELCSVIAKNGDDLPQEAFACQLITMISNIWKKQNIGSWTKRMKILITSSNTGLVETITNAISIHSIKKSMTEMTINEGENAKGAIFTLSDYFERMYGSRDSAKFKQAQKNFCSSLASYSIICYVLQIKDRHNGNIMLDNEGHIIHIDFGFLLSNSPGSLGFEAAPFKLTMEYVDLLGGIDSPVFEQFKVLCQKCFNSLRKEANPIVNIVELMQKESTLPCFRSGENTSVLLKQRLQLHLSDDEADAFVVNTLIGKSIGSRYTRLYDQFQMITQGIYS